MDDDAAVFEGDPHPLFVAGVGGLARAGFMRPEAKGREAEVRKRKPVGEALAGGVVVGEPSKRVGHAQEGVGGVPFPGDVLVVGDGPEDGLGEELGVAFAGLLPGPGGDGGGDEDGEGGEGEDDGPGAMAGGPEDESFEEGGRARLDGLAVEVALEFVGEMAGGGDAAYRGSADAGVAG
jgi:hypothetical protein